MTLRAVSPAPLVDLVQLYARAGQIKPREFRCAMLQGVRGDTIGFLDGDQLIAAAILYPCPPERPGEYLAELAFACLPAAAGHLIGMIHHARLTRARLAHSGGVRVRARVRAGHRPGQRLAALCGLQLVGTEGHFEVYEWVAPHDANGEGSRGRARRAVHGQDARRRV